MPFGESDFRDSNQEVAERDTSRDQPSVEVLKVFVLVLQRVLDFESSKGANHKRPAVSHKEKMGIRTLYIQSQEISMVHK